MLRNKQNTPKLSVELPTSEFDLLRNRYCVIPERNGKISTVVDPEIVGKMNIDGHSFSIYRTSPDNPQLSQRPPTNELPNSQSSGHTVDAFDMLTSREREIAMLISRGFLNKQIADQLRISEHTVSSHLRHIFSKLQVRTRAAMVYRFASALRSVP